MIFLRCGNAPERIRTREADPGGNLCWCHLHVAQVAQACIPDIRIPYSIKGLDNILVIGIDDLYTKNLSEGDEESVDIYAEDDNNERSRHAMKCVSINQCIWSCSVLRPKER